MSALKGLEHEVGIDALFEVHGLPSTNFNLTSSSERTLSGVAMKMLSLHSRQIGHQIVTTRDR